MKPVYFDLTVKDIGAARRFFERVLGWRFERFPLPYEYYRIQAGPAEQPGIDGGIGAVADAPICGGEPMVNLTMPVQNLDQALADVLAAGGTVVEAKTKIPGIGWYATCAEPGGLKFGLVEPDRQVQ
ncbi:MAG: VOC family protein [Alphaproteobacteria bacterium]|nr:VOC family protein [Alphaproteobacteria bacterium]